MRTSYADVIDWLTDCACQSKALVVRIFIEELAKFIRMNINWELDMSEENELKNLILRSTDSIESAFHVLMAMEGVKQELLKTFQNQLENKLNAHGFELVWDSSMTKGWKSCAGFGVKFSKKHNLYLRLEFNSAGLHDLLWGIRRDNDSINNDAEIWSAINVKMNTQFCSGKKTEWWPWWNWIDTNQELGSGFRHWDKSEIAWVSMKEGVLAEKIASLAIRVHSTLSDCLMSAPDKSTT